DRGRLWVVEAYVYPRRNPAKGPLLPEAERKNGDKILIFEDTDGDGKFDKKTVFMEGLNLVSGIEYGFGGLWVGAAPYFLFIPIDKSGDKPAGEPQILLDGWGYQDTHETLNSFIWGPDGWLYGCHGVFTHSRVGKPGTPDKDRTPINAGVWRYHPTKHTFEVFCHGTSNPWGLDYNQYGDFFIEACVIPHLWHMVQGGRYERQGGQHFNPYTYDDIKTIAKHRHYVGDTPHGGNNRSDSAGGGHAHSGLICYQGGAWPKEYHGKLFMGNIHGHRINVDVIKPKGSSYEGDRNPDFLLSNDRFCIIVAIHTGPDGNVYFCDWSDKQVCHTPQEVWDRTNGRLFKISHKDTKPLKNLDLQKLSDEELVKLQLSDNEWMVRHARRILQERAAGGNLDKSTATALNKIVTDEKDVPHRLRGLWALECIGGLSWEVEKLCLNDQSEWLRAWAVRFYDAGFRQWIGKDAGLVKINDESPVVRRFLASAWLRTPDKHRGIPHVVFTYADDLKDPVLPYLYWYMLEMYIAEDAGEAIRRIRTRGLGGPLLGFACRRIGAMGTSGASELLVESVLKEEIPERQLAYLNGLREFVKGKRTADAPKGWADAYAKLKQSANAEVRQTAMSLAVTFGDAAAMDSLRKTLTDATAAAPARQAALAALLDVRDKQLPAVLQSLLADPAVRSAAVRGLAAFDDSKTPAALLAAYPSFTPVEKRDAVATLASRSAFAKELLAAVGAKKIPSTDIPAEIVRQLRNLNDESVSKQIATVWGVVRDTPADRKRLIAEWGRKMNPDVLAKADLGAGRAVFNKVCAQCHTLYGVGGKVGPEITGANRA
ncbi:MAG: PVC-type heme-binding CxxCH protein, partial [Gemmataceae bacterium]